MKKTIGDYWRSCSNEALAGNMLDFLTSLIVNAGIPESELDLKHEYSVLLNFFNTEYEEEDAVNKSPSTFSYIH